MTDESGVARAQEYLDAFASGDRERIGAFLDEEIVWRVGGYHALSGVYRGREEVLSYFDRVDQETGGSLVLEPEAILSSDRHTMLYTKVRAARDGHAMDVTLAQAFRIGDDGRYTEYWALADDQRAVDEFWGS